MQREVTGTDSTVSTFRIIFADGSVYGAYYANVSEHVLQPVLLKFVVICVMLHSIIQWRSDVSQLTGWWLALMWLCITVSCIAWLYFSGSIASWLIRRGFISSLFTPFLTVPMVLLTETVTQVVITLVLETPMTPLRSIIGYVTRDIIVVLLFDMLFGSYVAAHHPLFFRNPSGGRAAVPPPSPESAVTLVPLTEPSTEPVIASQMTSPRPMAESAPRTVRPAPAAPAPRAVDEGTVTANAAVETVTIGGEVLRVADIGTIHAEDHYVRIQMTDRRLLLRARFSDVLEQMAAATGLQINRSDWVSLSRIDCLRRDSDYRLLVVLADGEALPVARPRRQDVLTFAQRHGIAVYRIA